MLYYRCYAAEKGGSGLETIEVMISGIVYRNDENGYTVMSCQMGRREITAVGALPGLRRGEQVRLHGDWVDHPQYGMQFKITGFELVMPTTVLGIERYLAGAGIRGIKASTAHSIVHRFGEETLTILSEHPERLMEIPGIGRKKYVAIAESFREKQQERGAVIFLQSYGIPPKLAVKISKLYGDRTETVVRENPYRLCEDIEGVGFQTADRIGAAMGVAQDSDFRLRAAVKYVLQEASAGSGHCYLPRTLLEQKTQELLRVDIEGIRAQITALLLERELTSEAGEEDDRIYLRAYARAEKEVAQRLMELMAALPAQSHPGLAARIDRFERRRGITFSQLQREALVRAMDTGVFVVTGGPGTGKTTLIQCLIEQMQTEGDVLLCAPTGRAAKRMSEASGMESRTIHRLLEYSGEMGGFSRDEENPLEASCVIVDEVSMVDLMLMRSLLRAIEPGTRLVLVGDSDQLPSVGAGNVLGDILHSGVIPAVCLHDIFRQSETSRIVVNAHRINEGEMPLLNEKGTDFFFERTDSAMATSETVVRLVTQRLPGFLKMKPEERVRRIQVLAPMRKSECGVEVINLRLQQALNPPAPGKPTLTWGDSVFRLGDKVMQTHNDYNLAWRQIRDGEEGSGVFNGDVGFITRVDEAESELTVLFDEEREAVYSAQQLENLELAYCLSVHKSQGSEFPVVVMPVFGGPQILLTRNLFYTALTRAKALVVLVGREETIRMMVENNQILRRWTALDERLRKTAEMMTP